MDYVRLREEPLKNAVRDDYFSKYKYTQIGNIDFVIAKHNVEKEQLLLFEDIENDGLRSLLWAEAKQGTGHDIYDSFVQLVLTIGKERTFERHLPPKYIGAFDAEKLAFIEYHQIQHVFYQNDFNWNVTPSDHGSKEFRQLHALCERILHENAILFRYDTQAAELREFIARNFRTSKDVTEKISVTKNNFTFVFQKWSNVVKPTIAVNWELLKKRNVISADFFIADLLSENNESIKKTLSVVLSRTKYKFKKTMDEETGIFDTKSVEFSDNQKAHREFWNVYERPPKEEYWDYISERRDLLVPQDIRERKGSFFTPQIWVEKSQQYLARVLGEGWQDEYYVWDCCAGTGNLLNGLVNRHNIFASTLDKQDVDVMKDRIAGGWNMFENHVFQFDFLNDSFDKCPEKLREILGDGEKRKKLVIYINPPYAETDNRKGDRSGVKVSDVEENYRKKLANAGNELYAQFLIKIYNEIPNSIIAHFSKLKHLQSPNFKTFRKYFTPRFKKMFAVPAWTFDNVSGEYPIGFMIWDSKENENFSECNCDVYNAENKFIGEKVIISYDNQKLMNDWIAEFKLKNEKEENSIGLLNYTASDFQQQKYTALISGTKQMGHNSKVLAYKDNLIQICIYFSVRLCIEPNWLNDRDQFLFPRDGWQNDVGFQSDCLIFTLFHGQNRISAEQGTNHWIPFTEEQVRCLSSFRSTFMYDFLRGFLGGGTSVIDKNITSSNDNEFFSQNGEIANECGKVEIPIAAPGSVEGFPSPQEQGRTGNLPVTLSDEAKAVHDAALAVWRHYHAQTGAKADASFYDIRRFFQGETNGRMNNTSDDEEYTALVADLRAKQKALAARIAEKVYEHGFLR